MDLVLINICNFKNKKVKIEYSNLKDFNIIYLYISKSVLSKITKSKIYSKIFEIYLRKKININNVAIYLMSKEMSKFSLDKYFNKVFNLNVNIEKDNSIIKSSIKYLENEPRNSKIAIICNFIEEDILRKYIERFREIVIFSDYKQRISYMVKKLSTEYGVSIDILDSKFDSVIDVDASVYFDDIPASFAFNAKKNYFFLNDVLDKYSEEYNVYNLYKNEIKERENFKERKLALAITYLHNFKAKN